MIISVTIYLELARIEPSFIRELFLFVHSTDKFLRLYKISYPEELVLSIGFRFEVGIILDGDEYCLMCLF